MMDNLYFFYGEEDYLIGERIKDLAKQVGEVVSVETVEEAAEERLGEMLSAQSLFAENRLVVIKDPAVFENKELAEKIPGLLVNSAPGQTVVFVYEGQPEGSRGLTKWLKEQAQATEFRPFAPWQEEEALAFIIRQAGRAGKKIGSHAARLLWEMTGSNLRHLSTELEKVITYIGTRATIEEQDVLAVVSAGEADVFSFVENLKQKQKEKSLMNLSRLLKENEDPIRVLGLLASQFRMLLQVKSLSDQKKDAYQIGTELKTKPFFVKKALEAAQHFSLAALKKVLSSILEADYKIKVGYNAAIVMEDLVLEICGA